jgi:hypothetical protein
VRLLRGRFGHRGSQVGFLLLFLNLNGLEKYGHHLLSAFPSCRQV